MKLFKLIPETIIVRIVDGFLAWCVLLLCRFMLIEDTETISMTEFFKNANMETLKLFLIISLVVGILKISLELTGIIKREYPNNCGLIWAIIMTGHILWVGLKRTILATLLLFAVDWVKNHFFLNAGLCNILEIVIILWTAFGIQVNAVPNCIAKRISEIVGTITNTVRGWFTSFFEGMVNLLGKRIVLAIIELTFCLLCTFLLLKVSDKIGLTEIYSENTTFLLSEWYEENGEDLMLHKLHLDKYFYGSFGEKEISGDTYNFLKVFPIGCSFAGFVLLLCGLGLLGNLAARVLSWNENALMEYDATHKKHWVRTDFGHGKVQYTYTNGNLYGILWLLLIILFFSLSFITGIFMPFFITGNLVIGIASLIFRGISRTA